MFFYFYFISFSTRDDSLYCREFLINKTKRRDIVGLADDDFGVPLETTGDGSVGVMVVCAGGDLLR